MTYVIIVGPGCTQNIIAASAAAVGAHLHRVTDPSVLPVEKRRCLDMQDIVAGAGPQDSNDLNCDIAEAALHILRNNKRNPIFAHISDKDIESGLVANLPCRFEVIKYSNPRYINAPPITVVLDMAHNEAGISVLSRRIKKAFPYHKIR